MSIYTGRFAPSPTGPLHFGSLVAAVASYLDAKHHNGHWLLRIEDLDPPRESSAAPRQIIEQLKAHGFEVGDDILYQSTRLEAYAVALKALIESSVAYRCDCNRKDLPPVYPGTCRSKAEITEPYTYRFRTKGIVEFEDLILGHCEFNMEKQIGDFIIRRKDQLIAYQLAVVVDDEFQGVTHIMRGADLLDSTPRQIQLIDALEYARPKYGHIPVALGPDGKKLSKQSHAPELENQSATDNLKRALRYLGQEMPNVTSPATILKIAASTWNPDRIPKIPEIPAKQV